MPAPFPVPMSLPSRRVCLRWALAAMGAGSGLARAGDMVTPEGEVPLRFGALPLGGHLEARRNWEPLLVEMSAAIGQSVVTVVVPDYPALERGIAREDLDMAYVSGKLALDAVLGHRMRVMAQAERRPGASMHRAILLARRDAPLNSLAALLEQPDRWRMARGDNRSVTGFILPQTQLFLPHGIDLETRFAREQVGSHQDNALAVANGYFDVATGNTTDFQRFREQFPAEAQRLQVIWESEGTPVVLIVVRTDLPPARFERMQAFLVGYGRAPGAAGARQRAVLRSLHASLGWQRADNSALLPVARLAYEMQRQRALTSQWVSDEAQQARLRRLRAQYEAQLQQLAPDPAALAAK